MTNSFFLARETVVPRVGAGMPCWCESLLAGMYRNVPEFFGLPPNQLVELGTRVTV